MKRSKQRPERLELAIDPKERVDPKERGEPKERGIFGMRETATGPGIGAERRFDGTEPETDFHDDGEEPPRRRVLPMVVALITLAGFAGIVWYAYDWGLGQVDTARLPVILADSEPIKSRPESPGGLEVPNQDTLVLNEVVPDPTKPQVERLLPPPETPRPPKAPSAAGVEIAVPPIETAAGPLDEPTRSAAPPPLPPPPLPPAPESAEAEAPQIPTAAQVAAQDTTPELAAPEPATPELAAPESAAPASPVQTGAVQTAARTPSGAYVVQLAAFRARAGTRPAWVRLQRAHPMLLGDKELTVQEVDLGERGIFYRVQAGFFPDRAGASALCRALKARQQDCLVVKR